MNNTMAHLRRALLIAGIGFLAMTAPVFAAASTAVLQTDRSGNATQQSAQVTVHNAAELVTAMLAATRTRQPTTIQLAAGDYQPTEAFSLPQFGTSALPPVSTTLNIVGQSAASTTIDMGLLSGLRAFTLLRGGTLLLKDLTISGGIVFCDGDCPTNGGGAVVNAGGYLLIQDCVLASNNAVSLDAIPFGGAVLNLAGFAELLHSKIIGNFTSGNGGGLAVLGGTVLVFHSVISGNTAAFVNNPAGGLNYGGGIFVGGGADVRVVTTTVSDNVAGKIGWHGSISYGGGIYNGGGTVSLFNSAVTENSQLADGGGFGGGIVNAGKMQIMTTTIGGNVADVFGAGIHNQGRLALVSVTIVDNTLTGGANFNTDFPPGCDEPGSPLCIQGGAGLFNDPAGTTHTLDAVIASNTSLIDGHSDCYGTLVTEGYNAFGDLSHCTLVRSSALHSRATHDLINVDPLLGAFQDNGLGGGAHYPVLAGSPLIDAGGKPDIDCTHRDQLGQLRLDGDADQNQDQGNVCDIGAIEFYPPKRR